MLQCSKNIYYVPMRLKYKAHIQSVWGLSKCSHIFDIFDKYPLSLFQCDLSHVTAYFMLKVEVVKCLHSFLFPKLLFLKCLPWDRRCSLKRCDSKSLS